MSPKIFLIRAYQINVTNLLPALAFRIGGDNLYIPTVWHTHNGIFDMPQTEQTCDIVTNMSVLDGNEISNSLLNLRNEFRFIKWSKNTKLLDHFLEQDKPQVLSHSVDSEIEFIKSYLGSDVQTLGSHFDSDDRFDLLKSMAQYHIYCLDNSILPVTEQDSQYANDPNRLNYYIQSFDKLNLIENPTQITYDVDISYKDYKDKQKIMSAYESFGLPFNKNGEHFYDTWVSNNSTVG